MLSYVLALILMIFSYTPLYAEGGQVINVNQSYQIAFVDLGNSVLKQGDIVKVLLANDEFVYMQVLESSSILSKLGPSQSDTYKTNTGDINRVAVGSQVVKVNPASTASVPPAPAVAAPTKAPSRDAEVEALRKELAEAKSQIAQLKSRLENMNKIFNKNSSGM